MWMNGTVVECNKHMCVCFSVLQEEDSFLCLQPWLPYFTASSWTSLYFLLFPGDFGTLLFILLLLNQMAYASPTSPSSGRKKCSNTMPDWANLVNLLKMCSLTWSLNKYILNHNSVLSFDLINWFIYGKMTFMFRHTCLAKVFTPSTCSQFVTF